MLHQHRKKKHEYRLWFIISPNGSVYSAFCECKSGSDQGCKHLAASLFELEEFLSDERTSVTSLSAYWQPKPKPQNKPLPLLELKLSQEKCGMYQLMIRGLIHLIQCPIVSGPQ